MKTSLQVPADHGLPALGLLCLALMSATIALGTIAAIGMISKLGGSNRLLVIGVLCAGFVRAGFHHSVANRMRERSPALFAATRRYAICAAITTALTLAAIAVIGTMSLGGIVAGALVGLYWPVTLWLLVSRKTVREAFSASDTFDAPLVPADRSIEGVGVLMTVFSALGLVTLVTYVVMTGGTELPGLVALVVYVALLLALLGRGVFHLTFGLTAMRGLPSTRFDRRSGVYFALGVTTAALLALFLLASARWHISPPLIGLTLICSYFVLAWPMALRRFASSLLFDAEGQPLPQLGHGPSPDRGLSALGYFLLAFMVTPLILRGAVLLGMGDLSMLVLGHADWITGIAATTAEALGIWAALELIRVSPSRKRATYLYAATALVAAALDLALRTDDEPTGLGDVLTFSLAFTLPLITLALVLLRNAPPNEATPPHGTPARAD